MILSRHSKYLVRQIKESFGRKNWAKVLSLLKLLSNSLKKDYFYQYTAYRFTDRHADHARKAVEINRILSEQAEEVNDALFTEEVTEYDSNLFRIIRVGDRVVTYT